MNRAFDQAFNEFVRITGRQSMIDLNREFAAGFLVNEPAKRRAERSPIETRKITVPSARGLSVVAEKKYSSGRFNASLIFSSVGIVGISMPRSMSDKWLPAMPTRSARSDCRRFNDFRASRTRVPMVFADSSLWPNANTTKPGEPLGLIGIELDCTNWESWLPNLH
jgi:hypothetical protein